MEIEITEHESGWIVVIQTPGFKSSKRKRHLFTDRKKLMVWIENKIGKERDTPT